MLTRMLTWKDILIWTLINKYFPETHLTTSSTILKDFKAQTMAR